MPQILVVDERLPEPAGIAKTDPAAPANIVLNTQKIQAQAAADSKYDIDPPQRIDPFVDVNDSKTTVAVAAVVLAFIILIVPYMFLHITLPLYARIAFAVVAIYGLHYIAGKFEKRTV